MTKLQIFIPFAFGYFLSYLYRVINAVLAPGLTSDLGLEPTGLGLLTSVYFLTFGAFQLPLGVLLDRFGPRKINAALLLAAAAGAATFARADGMTGLTVGRALIGFGVSACLMASFKAFVMWFPLDQLPRINGIQMAMGGLGVLMGTAPVEVALSVTDWRGVFTVLAFVTLIVAAVIWVVVPERTIENRDVGFFDQLHGIRLIFSDYTFWRIAPWTALSFGTFMSIQGLWAGPWLRDVAGMAAMTVAETLMWTAVAMTGGFIILGAAAERLSRRGFPAMTTAACGMFVFMALLLVIIFEPTRWAVAVMILFGFFGTSGVLPYAVLSQSFPPHLSGRANTALNLIVFMAAFMIQWGMGAVIGQWPVSEAGGYSAAGYRAAFSIMLGLQVIFFLWFVFSGGVRGKGR
mgnify:CR=1 FL=1